MQPNRDWICSICSLSQALDSDPCQRCHHPRDKIPVSYDYVVENNDGNEGEPDDDDEVEEQREGMQEKPQTLGEAVHERMEGEKALKVPHKDENEEQEDEDFSESDKEAPDDWSGVEFEDSDAPAPDNKSVEPKSKQEGWRCSFPDCTKKANSLLVMNCAGCHIDRKVNSDAIVSLDEDDEDEFDEKEADATGQIRVYACKHCLALNDFAAEALICRGCGLVVDTNVEGVHPSWLISRVEYEASFVVNAVEARSKPVHRPRSNHARAVVGDEFRDQAYLDAFKHKPMVIGKHCSVNEYPSPADVAYTKPNRIGRIVGAPSPLSKLSKEKSYWRDGVICFPCVTVRAAMEDFGPDGKNGLFDRGLAVNDRGWIALLTRRRLQVLRPHGASFAFQCEVDFRYAIACEPHPVRVRFCESMVYVFIQRTVRRFEMIGGMLIERASFADEYLDRAKVEDIDVDDKHILGIWRKWAGLWSRDCEWVHAVSHGKVWSKPNAVEYRNNYLHVLIDGCIVAFHIGSLDPTVLWVNGNLPRDASSFCVSDTHGVFVAVKGDIVQSYYDALNAQAIYKDTCQVGGRSVTPQSSPVNQSKHLIHDRLRDSEQSPFENVRQIQYDPSFGTNGRLLCWNENTCSLFMCLPRQEFKDVEDRFSRVFQQQQPRLPMAPIKFHAEDEIGALCVDDRVDFRCDDGLFHTATVWGKSSTFMIIKAMGDRHMHRISMSDIGSYVGRFAAGGTVTSRKGVRLLGIDIGSEVEVNFASDGWQMATVVGKSVTQVRVRLGNGHERWTHVDFYDEIRHAWLWVVGNLVYRISPKDHREIERKFAVAANQYSEQVVKFVLAKALNLDISSVHGSLHVRWLG